MANVGITLTPTTPLPRTALRLDRPPPGPPSARTALRPKFALFFPPATIFILSSLSGGLLLEFWWLCRLGLSKRAHFRVPALQNTTQIPREDPQEREERKKFVAGEGKKREILPLRNPTLEGPHPLGPHFSGFGPNRSGPTLQGLLLSPPSGPHFGALPNVVVLLCVVVCAVRNLKNPTFGLAKLGFPKLVMRLATLGLAKVAKLGLAKVGVGHRWLGPDFVKQLGVWPKLATPCWPNHGIWLHSPRGSCESLNSAGHHP